MDSVTTSTRGRTQVGEWLDVLEPKTIGEWVGFDLPLVTDRMVRASLIPHEPGRFSDAPGERWAVEIEKIGGGAASAWARYDGFGAFMTRLGALAGLFGGKAELQTFREWATGFERHEVRLLGIKEDEWLI